MPTLNFYTQADMSNTSLSYGYGYVSSFSSTHITVSDGRYTDTYLGHFTYSDTDLSGGTLNGYKSYEYDSLQYEISGANFPALTIKSYLDNGDGLGLYLYVLSGNDIVHGSAEDDLLIGWGGNDTMHGSSGNDRLSGRSGNDLIDGGSGINTASFTVDMRHMSFSVSSNVIIATDRTGKDGQDRLTNIQHLSFNDYSVTLPNALQYIASYGDLIGAFKLNADAGMTHFLNGGVYEGRTATFDALKYTASYNDLINAFGTDTNRATVHYIQSGLAEGRSATFEALNILLATVI